MHASPQNNENAIKQALDTLHTRSLARDLQHGIGDAVRAHSRSVDTMGRDIADWKETD